MIALDLGDHPLPEGKRLGVRVVDAKNRDAQAEPIEEDALQLLPHAGPVFALEIEGINILILLGRILRVLNRPVRPLAKPRLVLAHIRMIWSRLKRYIQSDGKIERLRLGYEALEIVDRSQLTQDGFVSAFACADRPRAAVIAGLRFGRVVAALPKRAPDGLNR